MKLTSIMEAQALRSNIDLDPISGPGTHIFPPTYADGGGHAVETLQNGTHRVLVDSVASQANRQEVALVAARDAGEIDFSDVYVDLSDTDSDVAELSATEMPHRLSDAILRDSEIDGVAFGKTEVGKRIISATQKDLSSLIEMSPTTVLYGCWFSGFGVTSPLRLQRSVVSEIWAHNAIMGVTVGGRSDPLGIESIPLYAKPDGGWTALESEAEADKAGKPKSFGRPSEIKHGQIPPNISEQGITADVITLRWALSLPAIRRLRFGGDARDTAGQAYTVALGILGRVLDHDAGYALRSRCDLISNGPLSIDVIDRNGEVATHTIDKAAALQLLREAEGMMQAAGLSVCKRVNAKPSQKLIDLIAKNAEHQAASNEVAE